MRSLFKKISTLICVIGILASLCIVAMFSASAADKSTLTLICEREGSPLTGIEWKVYRVGSYDGKRITLEGDFAQYKVTFGDYSAKSLSDAASTLDNYVFLNKPAPTAQGKTNSNGRLSLPDLESGVYLASGKRMKSGVETIIPYAALIIIDANGQPMMNVYPKFKIVATLDAVQERFEVRKIWENPNNLPLKKTEITVGVYEDGDLVETVKLNEENNWEYHWMVFNDADWRVIELDIPDDCTVVYRSDGRYYVVVNTYEPQQSVTTAPPPPPPPDTSTTPASTQLAEQGSVTSTKKVIIGHDEETTSVPGQTTVKTTATTPTTTTTGNKLPQTGQLWWPVPVMLIGGVVLIAFGMRIMSGKRKENNE